MRSFVRQVHYIDRDLIVARLFKGLGSLSPCSVLRSLQTPVCLYGSTAIIILTTALQSVIIKVRPIIITEL